VKRGEETKVEVVQCGKERRGEEERRRGGERGESRKWNRARGY